MNIIIGILLFMAGGVVGIITGCLCAAAKISDLQEENGELRAAIRWQKENVA